MPRRPKVRVPNKNKVSMRGRMGHQGSFCCAPPYGKQKATGGQGLRPATEAADGPGFSATKEYHATHALPRHTCLGGPARPRRARTRAAPLHLQPEQQLSPRCAQQGVYAYARSPCACGAWSSLGASGS